jgi:glucokinase
MACYIGLDIGGTKIAGGVVTRDGRVIKKMSRPTPVQQGGPKILVDAIDIARRLISGSNDVTSDSIAAIGVGAGGQIDNINGSVFSATDVLPGWKGLSITAPITEALRLPARVDNDVNVLGLGEYRFGAARELQPGAVLFLSLGTGVGGALLLDGVVHQGVNYSGGEFGHILLSMDPDARKDLGGAAGTLEAYCSGSGLVQTWRELGGSSDREVTGQDVRDDASANPGGIGSQAIAKTGEYLGFGLVTLANALDPRAIIIGGGLAELGDALLEPARNILKKIALPGPSTCPVLLAKLGGDAAIIGAASLVIPH